MTTRNESKLAYFRSELAQQDGITREDIRQAVITGPFPLSESDREEIIRELEASFDIRQKVGASVKADYRPWLARSRPTIDFYYWSRLRRYFLEKGILPPHVVSTLDKVTDEILDYSGDPSDADGWRRRGMVIGHVQSGKTTNYAALICKAADAGYKVIILLAGITNSLRQQTQERVDETFIGRKSVFQKAVLEELTIANYAPSKRFPAYGTSRDRDFSKIAATTYGVSLAALKEPIIFVTKKNKSTLENLGDWLSLQNHHLQIHDPLLLIDDEADNASINTSANPDRVTAINKAIRSILALFERSTYIGYTATPFANIFIDPSTEHEMLADDLFPKHFIKALDAPSNYIGAQQLFSDQADLRDSMIRQIADYSDILPLKHKRDLEVSALPPSLKEAIRIFLITRAIRVIRGDATEHSSMMINVSRFNDVQERIHGLTYRYLDELKNAILVNAAFKGRELLDPLLAQMGDDYENHFPDSEIPYTQILPVLSEASSSVHVTTVNMKGGSLDYRQHKADGLHVIAIGGLALSRGLTLEGLTVSYIIRNAAASDTLMQMARWFGYRPRYADLCRLYIPQDAREHYEYITDAIEELRGEVKRMEGLGLTPESFGLRVRQSPAAIRITAANKMRTASEVTIAQDYSARHIEGYALKHDRTVNDSNREEALKFLASLGDPKDKSSATLLWEQVPAVSVISLLQRFVFSETHPDLSPIEGARSLFLDYVADRIGDELREWDVAVPTVDGGSQLPTRDIFVIPPGLRRMLRVRTAGKIVGETFKLTAKQKAANPGDERIGLSLAAIEEAERSGIPGAESFCRQRTRPLVLVHLLRTDGTEGQQFSQPAVTLSFCMPGTEISATPRKYQVNEVYRRQLLQLAEEPDDDEPLLDEVCRE